MDRGFFAETSEASGVPQDMAEYSTAFGVRTATEALHAGNDVEWCGDESTQPGVVGMLYSSSAANNGRWKSLGGCSE